ncbi:MAG: 5-formyltetrahydrofolate cyclo-ligase [Alphaproteobacteria bacterium]
MTDASAQKAEIREAVLARRDGMTADQRAQLSMQAVARLRSLLQPGQAVALFWPIRSEIDPRPLIPAITDAGGTVLLPAIINNVLEFRRYVSAADSEPASLASGPFGTCHPADGAPLIDPDLIIAPLAAFDRRGNRIGYGAGHYDRAIASLVTRDCHFRLVGIAFACQEVRRVPAENHDYPLAAIATEAELIMPDNKTNTSGGLV